MNNEQQATKQARKTSDPPSPGIAEPEYGTPSQPETAEQLDKVEKEMTAFERSTIRLAQLAVFISIVAAIFMCAQWYEMHTGGIDTHDLAVAAKTQAEAARKQAEQAETQTAKMNEALQKTDGLIIQATKQARATNDLAKQARREATTAEQSLVFAKRSLLMSQRPWVVAAVAQLSTEPELNKKITIEITLVNSGRTPAVGLVSQAATLLWNTEPAFTNFPVPQRVPSRAILAAVGEGGSSTARITTNEWQLDESQLAAYKAKAKIIYVQALVRYKGTSGEQYWTKICEFHTFGEPLGDFSYCENNNEIGEGDVK